MKFDLHVHTSYSDGLLSPHEVVDLAVRSNLQGIAITDHDTVLGVKEAISHSRKYDDFSVIPGIEFGCVYNNEEVHILGYFIDFESKTIQDISKKLVNSRVERGIKMIDKLGSLGVNITLDDVVKHSGKDYIGRPHIARAMIDRNYVKTIEEAFDKYLNRNRPAYIERFQLTIEETIDLIKSSDGISVLAHPGLLRDKEIVNYCITKGIGGIECIHSKHSLEETTLYKRIAIDNGLLVTGGSDFHGDRLILGGYCVNLEDIPEMKARVKYV